jgi:hypothetical protein
MKPAPTDINRCHTDTETWCRTGLTVGQIHTIYTVSRPRPPPAPGRPWRLPLTVRVLVVLTHLRTNLTTRALAALFDTSQSAIGNRPDHSSPDARTRTRTATRRHSPNRTVDH